MGFAFQMCLLIVELKSKRFENEGEGNCPGDDGKEEAVRIFMKIKVTNSCSERDVIHCRIREHSSRN